jgi:two-component system, NtrC family, response regulator GlrR
MSTTIKTMAAVYATTYQPEIHKVSKDDYIYDMLAQSFVDSELRLDQLAGDEYSRELAKLNQHGSPSCEYILSTRFFTQDARLLETLDNIRLLAHHHVPVLIQGPPGVGKDTLARALHGDRKGAYIAVNSAELDGPLLKSELYGHKKGSFTGASADTQGLVSAAECGTLFLDEIGDLPLASQAMLLRLIESRVYRPVGTDQERTTNARFVFATNRNLLDMIQRGEFRQDLYDRMNTVNVRVESLSNRSIDELFYISARLLTTEQFTLVSSSPDFANYEWPGNVRELIAFKYRLELLGLDYAINSLQEHDQ